MKKALTIALIFIFSVAVINCCCWQGIAQAAPADVPSCHQAASSHQQPSAGSSQDSECCTCKFTKKATEVQFQNIINSQQQLLAFDFHAEQAQSGYDIWTAVERLTEIGSPGESPDTYLFYLYSDLRL